MNVSALHPIDCDVHIPPPSTAQLLPYLDPYWADMVRLRDIDGLDLTSYPVNTPLSCRPDWRGSEAALEGLRAHVLEPMQTSFAIGNCLHGAQAIFSEDLGAVLVSAVNQWLAAEWLDREPRLRASIVVHAENAERAVEEIERCAADPRFVQVLMLVTGRNPLGKRQYWPIYAAAERHGLAVGIHAGSLYHQPSSSVGWASYFVEEYAGYALAFQNQLLSFIAEGVFEKFPALKVVLMESGFTWLPSFMWRAVKEWRAMRIEVPWVSRPPDQVIREHVRITVQPLDAPPEAGQLRRVIEQIACDDLLLFATDYPHWHFDGDAVLPDAFPGDLLKAICITNPCATFPRLAANRREADARHAAAGSSSNRGL
jgi:uncharacterized protein